MRVYTLYELDPKPPPKHSLAPKSRNLIYMAIESAVDETIQPMFDTLNGFSVNSEPPWM